MSPSDSTKKAMIPSRPERSTAPPAEGHRHVRREQLGQVVPALGVEEPDVAVLQLADLLDGDEVVGRHGRPLKHAAAYRARGGRDTAPVR